MIYMNIVKWKIACDMFKVSLTNLTGTLSGQINIISDVSLRVLPDGLILELVD